MVRAFLLALAAASAFASETPNFIAGPVGERLTLEPAFAGLPWCYSEGGALPIIAGRERVALLDDAPYREARGALVDGTGAAWRPMRATVTAYTPRREECDGDPDVTATGSDAFRLRGIAADPAALPYGTLVRVPGYGEAKVDDTGGAMRRDWRHGKLHIDVRIPRKAPDGHWRSEAECVRLARQIGNHEATILVREPGEAVGDAH